MAADAAGAAVAAACDVCSVLCESLAPFAPVLWAGSAETHRPAFHSCSRWETERDVVPKCDLSSGEATR